MILDLKNLQAIGAFTGGVVKRKVEFEAGGKVHKCDVYVRPLSYQSAVSELAAAANKADAVASRISASICDENGNPVFTAEDITGEADPDRGPMNSSLVIALLSAIGEVNGLGKPQS